MSKYYYLDVSLNFGDKIEHEIAPEFFKNKIITALTELFGEVGACIQVDLLKYSPRKRRGILRVSSEHYVKLHSSLTLCGYYEGRVCSFEVNKSSPLLLGLQGDSRSFQH